MADTTTTNYSFTMPEVGASEDTWGTKLNNNWSSIDSALKSVSDVANAAAATLGDLGVTATAAELNKLDGVTATTTELNYIDGVTSNIQTQLNAKAPTSAPTFTGTATFQGSTGYPVINMSSGGSIYHSTINFGYSADSDHGYIRYTPTNGNMDFQSSNAVRMRLQSDGDIHADGDVIAYSTTISDERLKDDIVAIDGALDKLNRLGGYTFKYTANGKVSAGVIAQEVEAVLPEAVSEKQLGLHTGDEEAEYKVVNYDALHGLLIEAVKELTKRVEELEAK